MKRLSLIPHFLVIHVLVLVVSMVGFFPALLGFVEAGPGGAVEQSAKTCCCGQQGECCGMACCGTSAPKPDPAPTPTKPLQDRIGPVHFVVIDAITLLHGTSGGGRNGFDASRPVDTSGTTSLQVQQIRLQV